MLRRSSSIAFALLVVIVLPWPTEASETVWTHQFGTTRLDAAVGAAAAIDGSLYVAGHTSGALAGATPSGNQDGFLRRYDASGGELWTRQFGTSEYDRPTGTATDGEGNVYVAGTTDGAFPGENSAGGADAFLRRYDASGTVVWTRQFGSTASDSAGAVASDGSIVVVGGRTAGALPGQTHATPLNDAFVRAFAPDGTEPRYGPGRAGAGRSISPSASPPTAPASTLPV